MAPASYEPSSGVEYSNIPFYGNRKMFGNEKSYQKRGNKGKGKKIKVDPANRFSVLQGLTEEKQKKMFDKFENKSKIEEKYEEKCEEVCKDEEEGIGKGKVDKGLINYFKRWISIFNLPCRRGYFKKNLYLKNKNKDYLKRNFNL